MLLDKAPGKARKPDRSWKVLKFSYNGLTLLKPKAPDAEKSSLDALVVISPRPRGTSSNGRREHSSATPAGRKLLFRGLDLLMIPMMFFGILGGCLSVALTFQHGFFPALAAYAFGGAVFALIPGFLRRDTDMDESHAEPSRKRLQFPVPRMEIKE
jgi:hypothetical protein